MDSNISQIAKALGISPQAIRLYEEKGILNCRRNEDSGYRVFDRENITALLRSRLLRSFGFTMSDIAAMLNELDEEEILSRYQARHAQLEEEINSLRLVSLYLARLERSTRDVLEKAGTCEIATAPAYYLLPFMEGLEEDHRLNPKVISAWNELYPFRWDTTMIDAETMYTAEMKYRVAAILEAPYAERLAPEARVGLTFHPARQSVTAWFSRERSSHIPLQTSLAFALRFIEARGLTICGDTSVSAVLLLNRTTQQGAHFMASIPVAPPA